MFKNFNVKMLLLSFIFSTVVSYAQSDSTEVVQSNIQNYTPSKLLEKGKIDIKFFNNLYTQTERTDNGTKSNIKRENFFTSSLELFTGVSKSKKINLGLIIVYNSNTINGESATSVFNFKNELGTSRSAISSFAPSIKFAPFKSISNFSIQSSFYIPLHKLETNANVFLAPKSYILQNRFYYDYTFSSRKFQLFTELGTRFFFGTKSKDDSGNFNINGGYANNSLEIAPGIFVSYFPSNKFTILTFLQHSQLIDLGNKFSQDYSATGVGLKYQLSKILNLETIYSKFIRGNDIGLGQSFNLGLRAIF